MKGYKAVVGVYSYLDDIAKAINKVKSNNLDFRVYSPFGSPELDELVNPKRSSVRFVTGSGAVTGIIFGFALAILTSMDYPMRVSAKDVVSVPGFVVIGYECTILFGGICTLLAILHFCRLPDILRKVGYDPRFTRDKFGIVVGCGPDEVETVKATLFGAGADEVEVRDGL